MTDLTLAHPALTMTSREIAELTGKQHSHVLRDIRAMALQLHDVAGPDLDHHEIDGIFIERDARGFSAMIRLDKDHTLTLLTGYDAKARFRVIQRWQALEAAAAPKTTGEILLAQAMAFREHELRIERPETQQHATKAQVDALVDGTDNFTAVGYANLRGVPLGITDAQRLGRVASAICRARDWPVSKVTDPRFGRINAYPRQALAQAFEHAGLDA